MPRQVSNPARRRGAGGRILPHERDTNDDIEILGTELQIENFNEDIQGTLQHEMKDSTRKNYRNRIQAIVRYWKDNQQDYYNIGVREVSEVDLHDPSKYYYGKYKEDIVYSGMNADFFIKFLLDTKLKGNGKLKQYEDVRKYKDAILWGSGVIEERLPTTFYHKVERYLKSYKLLVTQAKKDGRVDERGADPISFTFYKLLLQWTIESNNVFLWFWTLAQWNNMARCASIDPLGFNNFKLGCDSIICKYDDSKTKKDGEKLSEKNIYANPTAYEQCFWTGMGVYSALNADKISSNAGKLFLTDGAKEGSAASRYQEQLLGLMKKKSEIVATHIRLEHANAYGIRKGSATYATSGTTSPPPIPSIARRGEWSMGPVLDVYWHFSEPGDHYLGRILSGLDPSDPSFGTLPPHFVVLNPMQNIHIKQAMEILYSPMLQTFHPHSNVISVLLRCLACIVYHSEKLLSVMQQNPGHDFNKIMLLQEPELLRALRPLVTLEPTEGVMSSATGIPPHITLAKQAKLIFDRCGEILVLLTNQSTLLIDAVKQAIEDKAFEQGHMTYDRLYNMFEQFKDTALKEQKEQLNDMRTEFVNIVSSNLTNRAENAIGNGASSSNTGSNIFCYGGRFFDVPEHYSFPKKVDLRTGLNFWLNGHHISEDCIIKPFRYLKSSMLPSNQLKNEFKLQWKGVYNRLLPDAENIPTNQNHFEHADIEQIYKSLVNHLHSRFSFCFVDGMNPLLDWKLGTWYNRTSRSNVIQHGSNTDKLLLPEETRWNTSGGRQNKRKRAQMVNVLYPHRRGQGGQQDEQ